MSTRLRFERTVNTGNYENFHLGVERDLADGEILEAAAQALQTLVDALVDERYAAVCPGRSLRRGLASPPPAPRPVDDDGDD